MVKATAGCSERLADRIEERLFHEHITPDDQAFILVIGILAATAGSTTLHKNWIDHGWPLI